MGLLGCGMGGGYLVALITQILSRIHPYSGSVAENSGSVATRGTTVHCYGTSISYVSVESCLTRGDRVRL